MKRKSKHRSQNLLLKIIKFFIIYEEQFYPKVILKNLQIFSTKGFILVQKTQKAHQISILKRKEQNFLKSQLSKSKKILFMDLDQTLIHTQFIGNQNFSYIDVQLFVEGTRVHFNIRPYLFQFLQKISKYYNIYMFLQPVLNPMQKQQLTIQTKKTNISQDFYIVETVCKRITDIAQKTCGLWPIEIQRTFQQSVIQCIHSVFNYRTAYRFQISLTTRNINNFQAFNRFQFRLHLFTMFDSILKKNLIQGRFCIIYKIRILDCRISFVLEKQENKRVKIQITTLQKKRLQQHIYYNKIFYMVFIKEQSLDIKIMGKNNYILQNLIVAYFVLINVNIFIFNMLTNRLVAYRVNSMHQVSLFYTSFNLFDLIYWDQNYMNFNFLLLNINRSIFIQQIQQNLVKMYSYHHNQDREVSSSEDNCRCQSCRNQQQLRSYQRQNPSNIYMFKHLKKRGVPPVKKQLLNKDLSIKAKYTTRKQQLQKKVQVQKPAATPIKPKLIQILKSKQISTSSFFIDYHQVSHSQRQKLPSKDGMANTIDQQHRRILNIQELRYNGFQKQHRFKPQSIKIVQISQNPENIKMRFINSRSVSQASANHSSHTESHGKQFKSLSKIKN